MGLDILSVNFFFFYRFGKIRVPYNIIYSFEHHRIINLLDYYYFVNCVGISRHTYIRVRHQLQLLPLKCDPIVNLFSYTKISKQWTYYFTLNYTLYFGQQLFKVIPIVSGFGHKGIHFNVKIFKKKHTSWVGVKLLSNRTFFIDLYKHFLFSYLTFLFLGLVNDNISIYVIGT